MRRLALLLLAGAAAGCGGGSGGSQQASTSAQAASAAGAARTITIHETEFELRPASVKLERPGTYVLRGVNDGTVSHAIAIEGNGVDEDGPTVAPGGVSTLRVTLTKAGTYEVYCPVDGHRAQGMEGTLAVGAAGAPAGGGTSTQRSEGSGY